MITLFLLLTAADPFAFVIYEVPASMTSSVVTLHTVASTELIRIRRSVVLAQTEAAKCEKKLNKCEVDTVELKESLEFAETDGAPTATASLIGEMMTSPHLETEVTPWWVWPIVAAVIVAASSGGAILACKFGGVSL